MFWPTMMIGSRTNWMNVWAIQATMMIAWPLEIAAGRLISASSVKMYAHHIVPTTAVMISATLPLIPTRSSFSFTGLSCLRSVMRGWGTWGNSSSTLGICIGAGVDAGGTGWSVMSGLLAWALEVGAQSRGIVNDAGAVE